MEEIFLKENKKIICKKCFVTFFMLICYLFFISTYAFAEERTYEGVGEYVMSDFETPDIAKQRAKSRAEQNAVEQAGVYVDSYTKSVNAIVVRDEITVITSGILRVMETKYSFQTNGAISVL